LSGERVYHQPRMNPARRAKIVVLVRLGRVDEARDELDRILEIDPETTISRFSANSARAAAPEFFEVMVSGLRLVGLPEG
jgi:hypothetical protein